MKIKYFITGLLFAGALNSFGQFGDKMKLTNDTFKTAALEHPDTTQKPPKKYIEDIFIGGGFVFGPSDAGDQIKYGDSREFIVGMGYGRKLSKWDVIGADIYYKSTGYFLIQDSAKILPNSFQHNSEKISFDNLGGLVFDRIYIKKVFFDAGFYFDWAMVTKHVTYDFYSVSNPGGGSATHSIDLELAYLNSYNYGLTFRFGHINGVSLYFNYRLTNVFIKGTTQNPDIYYNLPFPPFVMGIVIGVHYVK